MPDQNPATAALPSRRAVLTAGARAAVLAAAPLVARREPAQAITDSPTFLAARGWSALRSTPGVVTVRGRVVVNRNVRVGGIVIERGGALVFAPGRSVTVESRGNVVVRGALQMAPRDVTVRHRLVFTGADESTFVGGGMDVKATDVGLWVRGRGRLLLDGAPKTAWARADGDLVRGSTTFRLLEAPHGWRRGDELAVVPTAAPGARDFERYDMVRVVSVSGRSVTVSPALTGSHPAHDVGRGTVIGPEVLNLTRNVRIEGRPGRRAHVNIMGMVAQDMRHFALRYMGPRQRTGEQDFTEPVLGRYGLHFHMGQKTTRGTLVAGAVVRDTGSHAFVPHMSHGITFRSCISHDTMDEAYWWDGAPTTRIDQVRTNRLTWDSCVASLVRSDPPFRGFRLTGFSLGRGKGNRTINCVAVGVRGNENASGYLWPEGGEGVWEFHDNVAHNNAVDGIFTWQNTGRLHVIRRFIGYHNGQAGIEHGAYVNAYRYDDSILYANGSASVRLHALSDDSRRLTLDNLWCDGAGIADYGLDLVKHTLASGTPVLMSRCVLRNHRVAAVGLNATEGPADRIDIVDCQVSGNEVRADDGWVGGQVRWSDDNGAFRVLEKSSDATVVPAWNASKAAIADFAVHQGAASRAALQVSASAAPTTTRGGRVQ